MRVASRLRCTPARLLAMAVLIASTAKVLWRITPDGVVHHVSDTHNHVLPWLTIDNPVGRPFIDTLAPGDGQAFMNGVVHGSVARAPARRLRRASLTPGRVSSLAGRAHTLGSAPRARATGTRMS